MSEAIIIGGGIGGLSAAIALRGAGWTVHVYERAEEIREVGAGLTIWTNGLAALDRLGVGAEVRAVSLRATSGALYTWRGTPLMSIADDELLARYGEIGVVVHRADLLSVLSAALPADCVTLGAELKEIEELPERVTAVFADGRRATADILIGADGIRSVTREHVHGRLPLRYAGYTAWRCVVDFPHERTKPGETWGRGARFGQAPLRDRSVYVYATLNVPEGQRAPAGEKAELRRIFGDWHDPIPELVEAMREPDILRNDVYDLPPLTSWGRGRITLLGDAAHPMTPNLGQGACQAMEDAVVLARWLRDEPDPERALRSYETTRQPRAAAFVERSYQVGRVGQLSGRFAVWLRDTAARHLLARLQPRQMAEIMAVQF